jgi:hypothetical protein
MMLRFHDCIKSIHFDSCGKIVDAEFDEYDLFKWLKENYKLSDIFSESEICEFVSHNYEPIDIFDSDVLCSWWYKNKMY